jgi:energy-coupling factor transporter transmembrane protein EcfT
MRSEFNWFWHVVVPLISTAAIIAVGYESLQGLSGLFFWTPWVVLGWIVVGVIILMVMRLRGNEQWLFKAGVVAYEHQATPEELAG